MQRLASALKALRKTTGRLLARRAAQPKVSEYQEDFFSILEEVQRSRPDLIQPDVDVRDAFGILRSSNRGVTAHTINQRLPLELSLIHI